MPDAVADPDRFFDTYPAFVDSSETGQLRERLNARQRLLVHDNAALLEGATVLDIACHDGRFSFAALQAGATRVVGVDHKAHLLRTAQGHMDRYGVAPDRYRFLAGDLFDCLDDVGPVDVVLAFGILYHLGDHMRLFDRIFELGPRHLILDTKVSVLDGCVAEVRSPLTSPPPPGAVIELHPTRAAVEAMLSSFGWTWTEVDWLASGKTDSDETKSYRHGGRISLVVTCPEHDVPEDLRRRAVQRVLAKDLPREEEAVAVAMVARHHDLPPEALRTWVQHARRDEARRVRFSLG